LAFYSECVRFNCEAALKSVENVASFIQMSNESKGNYEMTGELQNEILDNIQNILTYAAALSRYFWPSRNGKEEIHLKRGQVLRDMFKVDDNSPLKNRKLRNQLEHLDENLDQYLSSKPIVGVILPSYVGGMHEDDGVPLHLFRAYYIDVGLFEVLGQRYEVQPLVDEIFYVYNHFNEK